MDRMSELGTRRGFAKQAVDRAKRELAQAEEEFRVAEESYYDYLNGGETHVVRDNSS